MGQSEGVWGRVRGRVVLWDYGRTHEAGHFALGRDRREHNRAGTSYDVLRVLFVKWTVSYDSTVMTYGCVVCKAVAENVQMSVQQVMRRR